MSSCGSWIGIASFRGWKGERNDDADDGDDDDDDMGNRMGGRINDDNGGGMRCCSIMSSGVWGPALVGDVSVELDIG